MCACISGNSQQGTPTLVTTISIIDKTPRNEQEKFPFEKAMAELEWYSSFSTLDIANITIYHIHGAGLDNQGNASGWILGVHQGDLSYLLIYDRNGWHEVEWSEQFISTKITLTSVINPAMLYEINRGRIGEALKTGNITESELDLSNDIYTVTLRSSTGIPPLRFNASTGESI